MNFNWLQYNHKIYEKRLVAIRRRFKQSKSEIEKSQKPIKVIINNKSLEYLWL